MIRNRFLLLLLLLGSVLDLAAQLPQKSWERRYGNMSLRHGRQQLDLPPLALPDGGFVFGLTENGLPNALTPGTSADVILTRVDSLGQVIWKRAFGGVHTDGDGGILLQRANDGNILFAAVTFSSEGQVTANNDPGNGNIWLGKVSLQGNLLAQRTIQSANSVDKPWSLLPASDGTGYLMTITQQHVGAAAGDLARCDATREWSSKFIRIDNNLNVVLDKCIGNGTVSDPYILSPAAGNRFYLVRKGAGASCGYNTGMEPSLALVNDTLGTLWSHPVSYYIASNAAYTLSGRGLLRQPDNSVIVPLYSLNTCTYTTPGNLLALMRVDSSGNLLWQNTTNLRSGSWATPVDGGDGSFLTMHTPHTEIGTSTSSYSTTDSVVLLKYNTATGQELGRRFFSAAYFGPASFNVTNYEDLRLLRSATGATYFWGYEERPATPVIRNVLFGRLGSVNRIVGLVYGDLNANGVQDAGEAGLPGRKVLARKTGGLSAFALSDNQGYYTLNIDTGRYNLSLEDEYFNTVPSRSFVQHSSYNQLDTVFFAAAPPFDKFDVSVALSATSPARPGFTATYQVRFSNNTYNGASSGTLRYVKPAHTTLAGSTRVPAGIVADTITWNYSNLLPLRSDTFNFTLQLAPPPTLVFNDQISSSIRIDPVRAQMNYVNDTAYLTQLLVGAYDPNDKREAHGGRLTMAQLAAGEPLRYTIRFQNTGTYTASSVVVRDTLSAAVDPASLVMKDASHPYRFTVTNGRELEWAFDNINLPDSTSNEPRSHGFLSFSVLPVAGLSAGTVIRNEAGIYFDYNEPVRTNREATTLFTAVTTAVPNREVRALSILAAPNPVASQLLLRVESSRAYTGVPVEIRGIDGSLLTRTTVSLQAGTNLLRLPVSHLPGAAYWVRLEAGGHAFVTKVVKQ